MPTALLTGFIDRRLLLNFRADPAVVKALLPFRAQLVQGQAMVGICLIRLRQERLTGLPAFLGLTSENGAHRVAVEWNEDGRVRQGVFIPRRDTSSTVNVLAGNALLGLHHHAAFAVREGSGRYQVAFESAGGTAVAVDACETEEWPHQSVFATLAEAAAFYQQGSVGYSPAADGRGFHGVALSTRHWRVAPLAVRQLASS